MALRVIAEDGSRVLLVKKCGCRRALCFKCGKPLGRHAIDRYCFRHQPQGLGYDIAGTSTYWCRACATRPAWPPPHANWK